MTVGHCQHSDPQQTGRYARAPRRTIGTVAENPHIAAEQPEYDPRRERTAPAAPFRGRRARSGGRRNPAGARPRAWFLADRKARSRRLRARCSYRNTGVACSQRAGDCTPLSHPPTRKIQYCTFICIHMLLLYRMLEMCCKFCRLYICHTGRETRPGGLIPGRFAASAL